MSRSKYEDKGISRRDVLKAGGVLITSTALCGLLPRTSAAKEARTPTNYKFKHLFKPCKIGKLTIKNRIIKSAAGPGSMQVGSRREGGSPSMGAAGPGSGPGGMPMGSRPDGGSPPKGGPGMGGHRFNDR